MQQIIQNILEQQNIRSNLSDLRKALKNAGIEEIVAIKDIISASEEIFLAFLQNDDAKTRKNVALLLGDLQYERGILPLYTAYTGETTLFVRSAYLEALAEYELGDILLTQGGYSHMLPELKERLTQLLETEVSVENKKHTEEEIRGIRKLLIKAEGITHHTTAIKDKQVKVILLTNRSQRETIRRTIICGKTELHPLGVLVETDKLEELLELRTYRDVVFPLNIEGFLSADALKVAKALAESDLLELLQKLHNEDGSFYFRIDIKSGLSLEERSAFTKKLSAELEALTKGALINSTSDYEVEIRLIANKEGNFFPCLKLKTIKDHRFDYRKNVIAASIHPSTAALMMELAAPYLKENAQIMDPFCGVGTMLIERDKRVAAKEMYGTDIFGEAIAFARENTERAGRIVHYIHRDFMDFKHAYAFDEIVSNMPLRGKKDKAEMDVFYHDFFVKCKEILAKEAILVLYTNELGFVKKQLRLQKEYSLLQETCLQPKNDFYLMILKYKG